MQVKADVLLAAGPDVTSDQIQVVNQKKFKKNKNKNKFS
jgi:hypothetical protein